MPSIVPEYRPERGVVFLGEDSVHGRVAVKVLPRKPECCDAEWHIAENPPAKLIRWSRNGHVTAC
jgi:hypothetical protein